MSYFLPGLWHLAAAMAFAVGLGALRGGDVMALWSRPEFVVACVLGSSALFFIPDAWAKKGLLKFLHYPLPDWDVLLLGPASHRHWFTHSPVLPLVLFWLSTRFSFAPHAFAPHSILANAACGLSIGLSSHLFWDCVSSRTHKIVFVPYWLALRPALSRIYLLGGAMISLLVALWFASVSSPIQNWSLPAISSTRNNKPRFQLVAANILAQRNSAKPASVKPASVKPEKVADVRTPEGVSVAPDGTIYAVENVEGGNIVRLRSGRVEKWLSTSQRAKDPDGRPNGSKFWGKNLFVADSGSKQIWAIAPDKTVQVIVDARRGECVNGPNDLAFAPDGSFYFTDPKWNGNGNVYRCARGKNGAWKTTFFAGELRFPNGIAVSNDGRAVYVGEGQRNRIWKIALKADGSAGNKRVWCDLPTTPHSWNGPDGMRFDRRGRLFVAHYGQGAIQVISPSGRVLDSLNAGGQSPTNVAFSRDQKTLYISETQTNAIYSLDLTKVR